MSAFRIRVYGVQRASGTIRRLFEDDYEITADSAPEALLQLVNHDLWWDTLDIDLPFTISLSCLDEEPA